MKFFSFLFKPYPFNNDLKRNITVSLFIGGFVAAFLLFFEPFEINLWLDPDKKIKLAGFGLVSFIIPSLVFIVLAVLPIAQREDKWVVWKEIFSIFSIVLLIAAGNLLYSTIIGMGQVSFAAYLRFIFITFSIGVFPIVISVIAKYNRFIKLNEKNASEVNVILENRSLEPKTGDASESDIQPEMLVLMAENEKDKLEIKSIDLLFIQSADNYSEVFYLKNQKQEKILLRGSLKRMEQQCTLFPELIRCHRAYIVNALNVNHMEGNAAGYKLTLKNIDFQVPVSRNYAPALMEKLKQK